MLNESIGTLRLDTDKFTLDELIDSYQPWGILWKSLDPYTTIAYTIGYTSHNLMRNQIQQGSFTNTTILVYEDDYTLRYVPNPYLSEETALSLYWELAFRRL